MDFHDSDSPNPIVEITLRGHLGFPNSLLELTKIREEVQKMTNALHVRLKNHTVPIEYGVATDLEEDVSREKLERRVIEDLIIRDNRYKLRAVEMAEAVVGAKRMALSDESAEKIVDFIALKLEDSNSKPETKNNLNSAMNLVESEFKKLCLKHLKKLSAQNIYRFSLCRSFCFPTSCYRFIFLNLVIGKC